MYNFRERGFINYNEDDYFDRICVFDEISSKNDLMDRIKNIIVKLEECPQSSKPDFAMICMNLCNEFATRYREHANFRKALKNKLKILSREPLMKEEDRIILQEYFDQL